MSSRALRRAQKELEERQRAQAEEEEMSEEEVGPASKPKASLFALLGNDDDDDANSEDEEDDPEETEVRVPSPVAQSKKSKKKKKKGKGKAKANTNVSEKEPISAATGPNMDEIDQALAALNLTPQDGHGQNSNGMNSAEGEELKQLFAALAVDSHHLQAANEMRKLFGRAAFQENDDEPARPRQRGPQQGLAGAVAGRNAAGGRNLASLGLRRNIFIRGKEEWPRATSGGLAMEIVEKRSDGTVEYRFVHNRTYQDVQTQFGACVSSMDPERMVQLLHFNPYHISTLLQVSEIAKQQRDVATAGDLLERALFTFGRAVHSTFANNLAQGKARLDFRRPENREFWLAAWRYIATLGVRSTWRTAFEWGKLLLALNPEQDPYCIRLLIDQLALRGREPQSLVDIAESDRLQRSWKIPPNLAMSLALAYDRLKNPVKARSSLRLAIQEYPWMAARLCKELDISPIPPSIWGKEPEGQFQELLCELYVSKAKDLWNTPEAASLLVEVAYSFEDPPSSEEQPYWLFEFDEIDLARHVILLDDRELLSLLDQRIKSTYTSTSDPLAPQDSINSYDAGPAVNEAELLRELEGLRTYFSGIDLTNHAGGMTEESLIRLLAESGTSVEEFRRNSLRVQELRMLLQRVGIQVIVTNPDAAQNPHEEQEEHEEHHENPDQGGQFESDFDSE